MKYKGLIILLYFLSMSWSGLAQEVDSLQSADSLNIEVAIQETSEVSNDTIVTAKDSVIYRKPFSGLALSVDYGKLITQLSDFEKKLEFTGHLMFFDLVQVSGEYGITDQKPLNAYPNSNYNVKGTYYKFGLDFLMRIDAKNNISAGIRYGQASYEDSGLIQIEGENGLFDPYERGFQRTNLEGSWWEFIVISEGKLTRIYNPEEHARIFGMLDNFYWGLNIRVRSFLKYDKIDTDADILDTYLVPGYGKTVSDIVPAINFILKYRLDF